MASKPSIGERLHLVRLEVGWSVAECAYRLTLNCNDLIVPDTWTTWERATDNDPVMQNFLRYAPSIGQMFGIDHEWLLHGPYDRQPVADVVELTQKFSNNPTD